METLKFKLQSWYMNLSTLNQLTLKWIAKLYAILFLMIIGIAIIFGIFYISLILFNSIIFALLLIILICAAVLARQFADDEIRQRKL